jgi:NAD(P)-dependent dehydrogenase (short-subunit alcohol dehydrogenase family)
MTNESPVRTALITGVSKGFGRAVAEHLTEHGWQVIGDSRNRPVESAALPKVMYLQGDITDGIHRGRLVEEVTKLGGGLDLLVNNASSLGPSPLPPLLAVDPDAVGQLFNTNVLAPLALIQVARACFNPGAAVINLSSDAAVEPYAGWGAYGASKAALDQISRVLAAENPEVRVFALDPGDMQTDMHQEAYPGEDISDRPLPEENAPAVLSLYMGNLAPGRYSASQVLANDPDVSSIQQ